MGLKKKMKRCGGTWEKKNGKVGPERQHPVGSGKGSILGIPGGPSSLTGVISESLSAARCGPKSKQNKKRVF